MVESLFALFLKDSAKVKALGFNAAGAWADDRFTGGNLVMPPWEYWICTQAGFNLKSSNEARSLSLSLKSSLFSACCRVAHLDIFIISLTSHRSKVSALCSALVALLCFKQVVGMLTCKTMLLVDVLHLC